MITDMRPETVNRWGNEAGRDEWAHGESYFGRKSKLVSVNGHSKATGNQAQHAGCGVELQALSTVHNALLTSFPKCE
jgi:hypothetical protein